MHTDFHSHILPGIDDGSKDTEMSCRMIEMMKEQGVERVAATPHFYAHRERGIERFLEKRQNAFDSLKRSKPVLKNILLGAEVAVEKEVSELEGIEKLALQETDLILLELPYKPFSDWMIEEIEHIASAHKLTPIIAHIHRYLPYYSKSDYEKILQLDAIFQINAEAFGNFSESRFVKKLIKSDFPLCFGSDAHNVSDRKPNLSQAYKKLVKYSAVAEFSDSLIDKHMK